MVEEYIDDWIPGIKYDLSEWQFGLDIKDSLRLIARDNVKIRGKECRVTYSITPQRNLETMWINPPEICYIRLTRINGEIQKIEVSAEIQEWEIANPEAARSLKRKKLANKTFDLFYTALARKHDIQGYLDKFNEEVKKQTRELRKGRDSLKRAKRKIRNYEAEIKQQKRERIEALRNTPDPLEKILS